jgi:integrase
MEQVQMPLNATQLRNIKPTGKTQKLFDGKGMYLEVSPKGGTWWRLKYRINGKEKRYSLGVFPETSLKDARDQRHEARKLIAKGVDPCAVRKAEKASNQRRASNSFEVVAREWFERQSQDWAESYSSKVIRRLEMYVFPWLGSQPISAIKAPDLLAVIRRIEERGTRETARRTLFLCGQVLRYAVATARAEHDCSGDLKGAVSKPKPSHFAAVTDPAKVGEVLRALDGYQGTQVVQAALKFAPLVFVRPGELRQAEWKNIDLEAAEWRFNASKTGQEHVVPLATQAVEILSELQPITGNGRYVFPSATSRKGDRAMSDNAILSAMRRMGIEKDEMSGHGFRAMARTILDEVLGFRPDFIEHQLAHAVRDPNGRAYNRTAHLPERRKMMQDWANYLDKLKAETSPE